MHKERAAYGHQVSTDAQCLQCLLQALHSTCWAINACTPPVPLTSGAAGTAHRGLLSSSQQYLGMESMLVYLKIQALQAQHTLTLG